MTILPDVLRVIPLADPVYDSIGHDPRSVYSEQFYLPILGPTSLWLARRLAWRFDQDADGFKVETADMACELGVSQKVVVHSIGRLVEYDAAAMAEEDCLAVRRKLAPLNARLIRRLPAMLAESHRLFLQRQHRSRGVA